MKARKMLFSIAITFLMMIILFGTGCTFEGAVGAVPDEGDATVSAEGFAEVPAASEGGTDTEEAADIERTVETDGEQFAAGSTFPSSEVAQQDSDGSPEDVVGSDGSQQALPADAQRDVEQSMPGSLPGGQSQPTEGSRPVHWEVFRDEAYGYEIQYPTTYVVVTPDQSQGATAPESLTDVMFVDKSVAGSDLTPSRPAEFRVRVLDNTDGLSVEAWIETAGVAGVGWVIDPTTVDGVPGLQVCSQTFIAPGCFIYVAYGNYVYQLIPLGAYSQEMLDSFRFT